MRLPFTGHTLCYKEMFGYLQKFGYFPLGLSQTPDFKKFRHVVNKTRRRRRRSSLLTTPLRQSTSRGCLLQVDQL